MNNFKKYSTLIIIGVLLLIILLQRSCTNNVVSQEPTTVVKLDTIWKITHDTLIKKIKVTDIKYVKPQGPEYTPGTDLDTCQKRFEKLLYKHIAKITYKDTLVLDSIGTVVVIDTVWKNKLSKRVYLKDYKIPFVTKTITITKQAEPKRQLYIGGNLFADKKQLQLASPGILYKTKKDHIYQANIGINFDGSITYGAGMYWKLSFKK